jgi:hypothetical protein
MLANPLSGYSVRASPHKNENGIRWRFSLVFWLGGERNDEKGSKASEKKGQGFSITCCAQPSR